MYFKDKFYKYYLLFKRNLRGKVINFFDYKLPRQKSESENIAEKISILVNNGFSSSENIIKLNSLEEQNDYFPLLSSDSFLESKFYNKLNLEIKHLMSDKNLLKENEKNKNIDRSNLLIDKKYGLDNLKELKRRKSHIYSLYEYLDSFEFRTFIYKKFNKYLLQHGFTTCPLTAFMKSNLYFQYCEARKGYENTIHIDRRSRVVHGLMYFGNEDFKGGEFSIYKHRKLKNSEYKRAANEKDILECKNFEPSHNKGFLILSTPNSYHKGSCAEGLRRFLYWGYTCKKNCWINSNTLKA